jgi:protein CpxP
MSASIFCFPLARTAAVAALMGATCLAGPLASASAQPAPAKQAPGMPAKPAAAANATSDRGETVEHRITNLHAELRITPAEEPDWNTVATTMRANAVAMDKLVAEKKASASKGLTAVEDLETYQAFAQAHLEGLKTLIPAFEALYASMPDAQKKAADQVFDRFGSAPAATQPKHG